MNCNPASARIRFLSSEGWKAKSKPARVLIADSLAIWTAILVQRFSRMVSSSVSNASMSSTAPISPRSMPRRVRSRTSSARGIFKANKTGLDALDDGWSAHRTPPRPARRRPTAA